ncbi:hypothetical protein NBRC10512v2_003581 [Rhodotorula toruloides]
MSSAEAALGPFYLGTLFQLFLFGIHWQQVFDYYRLFPTDRLAIKAAVAAVFVVGSFHISCSIYTVWFYAIAGYGQPSYIADCVWSFAHAHFPAVNPLQTAIVAAIVQLHYAWRVYLVSKRSIYLSALISLLTLAQFALGLYTTSVAGSGRHPHHIRIEYAGYGSSSPATETELDLPLPPAYYLRQVKSDFGRTNSIIGRIIRLTVANNAITAVTAVCSGSLFVADNQAAYHVFFSLTIIHSYAISFLSSLKSRKTIASEIARGSDPTKDYVSPPPKAALSGPVNSPPGSGPESYELRNKMRFPRTRSLDSLDSAKLAPAEELVANNGGVPIKIRVATEIVSEKGTDSWEPQYFNPTSSALSSQYEPEIVSPTPPFTTSDRSAEFPGRQKIIISKKWGFTTNLSREEYLEKRSIAQPDGAYVQFVKPHGPLEDNLRRLERIGA